MSSPNTLFTDWITFLTPTGFLLSDSRDAEVYVFSWNIKLLQSDRNKAYDFLIYPKRKSIINDPKRSRVCFGLNSSTIYSLPIIESTLSFIAQSLRLIFYKSTNVLLNFEPVKKHLPCTSFFEILSFRGDFFTTVLTSWTAFWSTIIFEYFLSLSFADL